MSNARIEEMKNFFKKDLCCSDNAATILAVNAYEIVLNADLDFELDKWFVELVMENMSSTYLEGEGAGLLSAHKKQ